MTEVTKLPANCDRLVLLDEAAMAACGQKHVYFRSLAPTAATSSSPSSPTAAVEVPLPKHVGCCAPWHPPGAPLEQCGAFYAEAGRIHFRRCGAAQEQRDVLESPPPAAAAVEEMEVFFGTTLVVRTAEEVLCYALDPSSNADATLTPLPPLIGRAQLPHSSITKAPAGVAVMMGAAPTGPTSDDADHAFAVVVHDGAADGRVDALLLAVGQSRVTVRQRTAAGGLTLPHGSSALRCWSFDWSRRAVLFVLGDGNYTCTLALDAMA
ncbi:hypothetical protein DQ04_22271000, partial [Trypanosoma grayi]|uniref:hypothetical protein n=1 Tax=Trypanosoma grayi TaxID=71804 RepID=UPI0004F4033E